MNNVYYNLTLKDFIDLQSVEGNGIEAKKDKLSILYKIERNFFDKFTSSQIISLYADFEKLERQPIKTTYKKRIKVKGKWFYVDYRLSQINSSQFIDITHFAKDNPIVNIHKIVASCIRPISWRFGNPNKYNGSEHEIISDHLLKHMKVKDAYPIMLFFCSLSNKLSENILTFFLSKKKEMENKLKTFIANGDGLQQ
jgi:hypothetical protein